ncbi:uncharacterized protein [Drosophila bipectinata]|uniref:uncharacterized protein n=1 Tax=Drosophila bipectinata TaxID=42026 RepID=UPI001C8949D3|nr:uncharacterized protein LOC108130550 [Drosophila bipectinata]
MPPCRLRQTGMGFKPSNKNREKDGVAPHPVHPRSSRFHGFLGMPYVQQHVMVDERWTPISLTEQFKGMTDLLTRRLVFKSHESKADRQKNQRLKRRLNIQCRDGNLKLQNVLVGDNAQMIRNYLINHRDMQRLYQKMPIHLVVDNINQRTFVMRKERDRLEFRLSQLKKQYKDQLLEEALLENRIKFEHEALLDEEVNSRIFLKKIENSNVRLKAIKTINNTYKKMIQVLLHDEIFYEPILISLGEDLKDQKRFLQHILYLGIPAIAKFKELSDDFRNMETRFRNTLQAQMQTLTAYRRSRGPSAMNFNKTKEAAPLNDIRRYVRETRSMMILKLELKAVEKIIKEVKFVTLCSQAKEIYPRMKSQVENNEKLHRKIVGSMLNHEMLNTKERCANVLKGVLVNNLSDEEIKRLETIAELKNKLKIGRDFKQGTLKHLENRATAFFMMRVSIWNLLEILRHVERQPSKRRTKYPNSYLRLPLLKFEMFNMRAVAPEIFDEDMDTILNSVKRKIYKLMKLYPQELSSSTIAAHVERYHCDFLASLDRNAEAEDEAAPQGAPEDDLLQESKAFASVPSRKQIKAQSAKVMEEAAKQNE